MARKTSSRKTQAVTLQLNLQSYRKRSRYLIPLIAVIAALTTAVAAVCFLIPSHDDRIRSLRVELAEQVGDSNFEGAIDSLEELQKLSPENLSFAFQRAIVEDAMGNTKTADSLISRLVAEGHAEAAFWELGRDFSEHYSSWDENKHARFEKVVLIASKSTNSQTLKRSKELLAAYQLYHNQVEASLTTLHEATLIDPAIGFSAAFVARQLGLEDRARQYLINAQGHFARAVIQDPQDDRSRLQLARAFVQLGEESQAVRLLSEAFRLTKNSLFQQAAAEAMVMWARRVQGIHTKGNQTSTEEIMLRLKLIHRATQCAPNDQVVLRALADLLVELRQSTSDYEPKIQAAMAHGFDHESAHFMLAGTHLLACEDNEFQLHCDLAEAAGSHVATVLNNLALLAIDYEKLSLRDGLQLVDGALQRLPEQAEFHETRGRLLMALGKYPEAIEELEQILSADVPKTKIYENLAIAYGEMGVLPAAMYYETLSSGAEAYD